MEALVFKGNAGQALTSSLLVAEKFEKRHADVLRAVDDLLSKLSENECERNFALLETRQITMPNGGARDERVMAMTRDGFTLLVMGFTGKKALKFKLDYIAAFNDMEKRLKEQQKPLSAVQMFALQSNINLEHEERLSNVEQKLEVLSKEREENTKQLLSVSVSVENVPEISLRDKIRQLVNKYSSAINIDQRSVWHKVYEQLYYRYHISINSYHKKSKRETSLDVAERKGHLEKMYAIVSDLVKQQQY